MLLDSGKLSKDIIKLLTYFDLFDYPLTSWEIWQLLPVKCSYHTALQALEEPNKWHDDQGFYYLQNHIATRQHRYNISDKKFKRAKKITRLFSFLPWIRMVCLANIIGQHNLKDKGDIDLFIITKQNRIWITRQFCVMILKILRLRPTAKRFVNTICLSFMIDDHNLNLESLMLNQDADNRDRYFTYWLAGIQPLYGINAYNELIKQNQWIISYLPNWQPAKPIYRRIVKDKSLNVVEKLFGWAEPWTKKFQYKVMDLNIKEQMNKSTNVVVNDHVLKLHVKDGREKYYQEYLNNLNYG
ncbi:MAG: hypothetical protein ABIG10_01260 [bacterium]